ncbi:MAG: hypothetical protein FJY91_00075 [Candidatus Harrisonbacteria bacterium]|nr:hypothetical protein [Candidatus Harrisonbacteria bacterium]
MFLFQFVGPLLPKCSGRPLPNGEAFCTLCDLLKLLDNFIKLFATLAPILAGMFMMWGGLVILTSGESQERIKAGKNIIKTALIGLIIVMASWVIISSFFLAITGGSPYPWYQVKCG